MTEKIRLSKLMSEQGICSRREADRFIEQGQVRVDGKIVNTLGSKVYPNQIVTLADRAQSEQSRFATVLINKPAGYVSGLPEKGYQSAVLLISKENRSVPSDRVPSRAGLAPAGRLDIDSTGLMVYTADGRIAKSLIAPDSVIEKEYRVTVEGSISKPKLNLLCEGLALDNKKLKPAKVVQLGHNQLKVILTEGRKRQIRRMCELVDLHVIRLKRIRIGKVELGKLKPGAWRLLRTDEYF